MILICSVLLNFLNASSPANTPTSQLIPGMNIINQESYPSRAESVMNKRKKEKFPSPTYLCINSSASSSVIAGEVFFRCPLGWMNHTSLSELKSVLGTSFVSLSLSSRQLLSSLKFSTLSSTTFSAPTTECLHWS